MKLKWSVKFRVASFLEQIMIPSGFAIAAWGENRLDIQVANPSAKLNTEDLLESKKFVLKSAPLKILAPGTCVGKCGALQRASSLGSVLQASRLVQLQTAIHWICLLASRRHQWRFPQDAPREDVLTEAKPPLNCQKKISCQNKLLCTVVCTVQWLVSFFFINSFSSLSLVLIHCRRPVTAVDSEDTERLCEA